MLHSSGARCRVLLAFVALGSGCPTAAPSVGTTATKSTPPADGGRTPAGHTVEEPMDGPRISLRRTACLGACPDYTLTIRPDGRVEFVGRLFVATEGVASDRIESERAQQMFDQLQSLDFFELSDCVDKVDVPQLVVELETEERSHRVAVIPGCHGPGADALRTAASTFERAIGVSRWVGRVVPCGFGITEKIYFGSNETQVSKRSAEILGDIATVLRDLEVPTTLVGSHAADEPPQMAIDRASAVRDALVGAGVSGEMLSVDSRPLVAEGPAAAVHFRIDVPECKDGQRWRQVAPAPAPDR